MLICLLDPQVRCGNDVAHLSPSVAVAVAVSVAATAELGRNLRRMINLPVSDQQGTRHPSFFHSEQSLPGRPLCCVVLRRVALDQLSLPMSMTDPQAHVGRSSYRNSTTTPRDRVPVLD
jgi:hypothetical protein